MEIITSHPFTLRWQRTMQPSDWDTSGRGDGRSLKAPATASPRVGSEFPRGVTLIHGVISPLFQTNIAYFHIQGASTSAVCNLYKESKILWLLGANGSLKWVGYWPDFINRFHHKKYRIMLHRQKSYSFQWYADCTIIPSNFIGSLD
jgi:hypothetical protein